MKDNPVGARGKKTKKHQTIKDRTQVEKDRNERQNV